MTIRPVINWSETTRRAEALADIIDVIAHYPPPDSGVQPVDALSQIIGIIETRTNHRFIEIREASEPA